VGWRPAEQPDDAGRPSATGSAVEEPNRFAALCTATGTIGLHERHWSIGMNNIIYIVGLVVVVIAVLSFFGLR
jgi:hypothetical protein